MFFPSLVLRDICHIETVMGCLLQLCWNQGPLLKLPAFQVEMIRWDGMHTVNLGTDLWVCGSVLRKLLEYDVFGDPETMDEADRLLVAYDLFRAWCRANKVQYCGFIVFEFGQHHLFYVKYFPANILWCIFGDALTQLQLFQEYGYGSKL